MTGSDALLAALAAQGVEVIFGNPGSTELPIMLGVKRLPSSLNQLTTARLHAGCSDPSCTRRATSRAAWAAASTP